MQKKEILLIVSGLIAACTPYYNSDPALANLATGYVVSVFFYFLLVRIPEHRKNKKLIAAFERKYHILKQSCITIILSVGENVIRFEKIEELSEPKKFSEYAQSDDWYDFANGLDEKRVNELKHHFKIFREELNFFLSSIDITDEKLFEKFENILIWSSQMELLESDYDDVKTWGHLLCSLLSDWSPIDGTHENGIIGDLISELKLKA